MKNRSLSAKLIGGFAVVSLLLLFGGVVAWNASSKALEKVKTLSLSEQLLMREIDHLNWAKKVAAFQLNEHMSELDVEKDEHRCAFGRWYYSEERREIETEIPGIKDLLQRIEHPHRKLHQSAIELEKILRKGKGFRKEALDYYQSETVQQLEEVRKILGEIRPRVQDFGRTAEAIAAVSRDKAIAFGGTLIGILVALVFGVILSRSIANPIYRVIKGLAEGADQVASASTELSSASQALADGASRQAAGLEETSSSIEEMASMTRQNADNAHQANVLMAETSQIVDQANASMNELNESMKTISAASEKTAKIIKTIDEIAFQTNLLALNAAVEAARAGEAGAGFAVVADEVRNLAMRAGEAAKNTADLIEDTVKKIKNGSDSVLKTNETFRKVAASAKKVGELVSEIAVASNEQALGIEQINRAVSDIDKVVQKNAASAEESASASEQMNAQADQMKGFVTELVTLVRGRNHGNGAGSVKGLRHPAADEGQSPAMSYPREAAIEKSSGLSARKSQTKGPMPDQVIPLEGHFKEF